MNSYIEVAWLISWVIALCAHALALSLVSKRISRKRLLFISGICTWICVLCYDAWYWVFLAELMQAFFIYKRNLKAMLQMQLIRLFYLTVVRIMTHGIIVNTVLFVEQNNQSWIYCIVFLLFLKMITERIVAPFIFKEKFEMKVKLRIQGHEIHCQGYLDTGNTLRYKNCPVLFLSVRYRHLIREIEGKMITFRTIHQENQCLVYPCTIYVDDMWKPAYVALSKQLAKPVDCLLNSRLFC